MASLTGNLISSTYQSILKIGTNNTASANLNNVTDGAGNVTGLYVSTATTAVSGTLAVLGNMTVSGVLAATASQAISASHAIIALQALGASIAITASRAVTAANAETASIAPAYLLTSSFNASTGSYLRTGSNTFVGDQIVTGSIIPGGLTYDLGSAAAPWQELYVSTGSINFVSNGAVVSTLGASTDGTQITGSLNVSGSIRVGSRGNIQETSNALHTYNQASGRLIFGSLTQSAATQDNYISFNGAPYTAASTTAVTIWGSNTGDGPVLFLNRKSSTGREDTGYTPWTIGVGQAGTSTPEALYVGTGNIFLNRSIEFNYKGLNTNILFSGSGIIPATANTYDLGTVDKPWRELYISTGSVNFVNNGVVVSTLGAGTNGTQITGSLNISGSIVLGNQFTTTTIKNLDGGGFAISATGSSVSRGAVYIGYLDGGIESDSPVAINGPAVNAGGYRSALTINGPSSGTVGGGIWLNRTGNGNIPWGILSDGSDNLFFGRGDAFTDNQIQFNYKGLTANILFSGSGIVPATANTYDLGTIDKPWRELYVSTGSINFVNNGAVVSTLSATTDSFNLGTNITIGSGRFEIGRRGTTYANTNVIMGVDVMTFSTGQHNVGIGQEAGSELTSGNYNIMLGYQAGRQIGPGSSNVLVGQGAGNTLLNYTSIVPSFNTFVGGNAGQFVWTGQKNVGLGSAALYGRPGLTCTFQNSTALGANTATKVYGTSTNNIYIGAEAGPNTDTEESYKFYVENGDANQQPFMYGDMSNVSRSLDINARLAVSGSTRVTGSLIVTGSVVINGSSITPSGSLVVDNWSIGKVKGGIVLSQDSLYNSTVNGNNIAIGYSDLQGITTGTTNIAIGTQAIQVATVANNNIAIGSLPMFLADGPLCFYNLALGESALQKVTEHHNIALGQSSLAQLMPGTYNVAIGTNAGAGLYSGSYNTFLGDGAGHFIKSGSNNTVIGGYTFDPENFPDTAGYEDNVIIADGQGNVAYRYDGTNYSMPNGLPNYTNDAAAASGGVPVNGMYRSGSVVMIRVS